MVASFLSSVGVSGAASVTLQPASATPMSNDRMLVMRWAATRELGDRSSLTHPPDRVFVTDRRRRDEPVLDRAVVALGLAEIHRDRGERLIGLHELRTVGDLA